MADWTEKAKFLEQSGDFTQLFAFLRVEKEKCDDPGQQSELLSCLMRLYLFQSRPGEAYKCALEYEKLNFLVTPSWHVSVVFGYLYCGLYLLGIRWFPFLKLLSAKISPTVRASDIPRGHLTWLLYSNLWNRLRRSPTSAFLQLAGSDSTESQLLALGYLGYCIAYVGHSIIGNLTIKKVIWDAKTKGCAEMRADLFPLQAIAYQMAASPNKSLQSHEQFASECPNAGPFLKLLSLVNRITVFISELDLRSANSAIDKCFSLSFALNDSRNHVQIYGYKALLFAIEGNKEQALALLERAEKAAVASDNPLDHTIFNRIAAVLFVELGRWTEAKQRLETGMQYCKLYGRPAWHEHEFERVRAIIRIKTSESKIRKARAVARFLFRTFATMNLTIIHKGMRLAPNMLSSKNTGYWAIQNLTEYLTSRISEINSFSDYKLLSAVTMGLSNVLLDTSNIQNMGEFSTTDLVHQITKAFNPLEVCVSHSMQNLLDDLRVRNIVSGVDLVTLDGDRIKVPCKSRSFLLAIQAPKTAEWNEDLVVGIRLQTLDLQTETLIEAGLRIIVTHYVFNQSIFASRGRYVSDQRKVAVAELAAQVAHDIRSPLTALNVVSEDFSELPEKKRILLRSAVARIQDIANGLLNTNRSKLETASEETASIQILSSLVDALISEKRAQYRSRLGVEITTTIDGSSYGLFACVIPTEFKRVVSNIINNAVEAFDTSGRVEVGIHGDIEKITVWIRDSGKGIPSDVLSKLTMKGFSYEKVGGSGLGLYHAKTIVEAFGGSLAIESKLGEGTIVKIGLKRSPAPAWFLPEIQISPFSTVLVLDDDLSVHHIWQKRFDTIDNSLRVPEIIHFSTSKEVIDWYQKFGKDNPNVLYLIDHELLGERMTGIDIIDYLGAHAQSVLVTSRFEEPLIVEKCQRMSLKLLPKSMAGFIPIKIGPATGHSGIGLEFLEHLVQ